MIAYEEWLSVKTPRDYLDLRQGQRAGNLNPEVVEWINENCAGWVYCAQGVSQMLSGPAPNRLYFEIEGDMVLFTIWLRSEWAAVDA